ncbi:hypothetical protein ACP70R_004405 [Stipagrostis hirtigluma subsp. patula]
MGAARRAAPARRGNESGREGAAREAQDGNTGEGSTTEGGTRMASIEEGAAGMGVTGRASPARRRRLGGVRHGMQQAQVAS